MANAPTQDPREKLAETLVCHDVTILAPKFQTLILEVVEDLNVHGYDVHIYETGRSRQLAQLYFALKRSKAVDELHTWHGYRLAVDLISKARGWNVWPYWSDALGKYVGGDPEWWQPVVATIRAHGLRWGGDWEHVKDAPHVQWHVEGMHESPSDTARALLASGGYEAVWKAVGAD